MIVGVTLGWRALNVVVFFLAHVEFAADDRLHARVLGCVDKMHGAENVAVIGHGHGRHAEFFHALDEFLDVASSVKHRIVGVEMQVYELRHGSASSPVLTFCSVLTWLEGTAETFTTGVALRVARP